MVKALWRLVAWVVTRPAVFAWMVRRSAPHPYDHIASASGAQVYMYRYWLFNPYGKTPEGRAKPARWNWLPSIRLHHIMRADSDRHLHDHPWDARTIVLRGWYVEDRLHDRRSRHILGSLVKVDGELRQQIARLEGYTGPLRFGEYHSVSAVSDGGVWTLFFTWRYCGTWGFLVDGVKVPYRKYLGLDK